MVSDQDFQNLSARVNQLDGPCVGSLKKPLIPASHLASLDNPLAIEHSGRLTPHSEVGPRLTGNAETVEVRPPAIAEGLFQ